MKSPIADTDLISARKAAIAFKEDADMYYGEFRAAINREIRAKKNHPIFYLAGVMTGVVTVLIAVTLF